MSLGQLSKFCVKCGTEFDEGSKFCVACGQRRSEVVLPPEEITTSPPEPRMESSEEDTASMRNDNVNTENLGSADAVVEKQAAKSSSGPIEFVLLTALLLSLIYVVAIVAFTNNAETPSGAASSSSDIRPDIYSISPSDFEILDENWAFKLTTPTDDCLTLAGTCIDLETVTNEQCRKGKVSYDLIDGNGVTRRLYDDFFMTVPNSSRSMSKSFIQLTWQSSRWQEIYVVGITCISSST